MMANQPGRSRSSLFHAAARKTTSNVHSPFSAGFADALISSVAPGMKTTFSPEPGRGTYAWVGCFTHAASNAPKTRFLTWARARPTTARSPPGRSSSRKVTFVVTVSAPPTVTYGASRSNSLSGYGSPRAIAASMASMSAAVASRVPSRHSRRAGQNL